MRALRASVVFAAGLASVACGTENQSDATTPAVVEATTPGPDVVRIEDPGLHPEGIEWDAAGERFLVGSIPRGTVTQVLDDGTHSVFVEDPDIVASVGLHIDRASGRLLVANANTSAMQGGDGLAMLGSYDLETGERIFMADLGSLTPATANFANDVTTAPDGTAYVTNFATPAIYVVSPTGEASVLVEGEPLAPGGINGIDLHPDGYLLVAQMAGRSILRIPLADPSAVHTVVLAEPLVADGLVFTPDGRLIAVAGTGDGDSARKEVLVLESSDGWESATITARWTAARDATTAALRGEDVYVIDARFADMGGDAPHFDIARATLGDTQR